MPMRTGFRTILLVAAVGLLAPPHVAATQAQPSLVPPPAQPAAPQPPQAQSAPAGDAKATSVKPYSPVAVTLPQPVTDASFQAFRRQLATAAQKKDRAALARLVVARGFFWQREDGDGADKRKSGIDNLSAAIGLGGRLADGWEMLAGAAEEMTLESSERAGVMCGPANPTFDDKAFEAMLKATETEDGDWGYPLRPGVEMRASAAPDAAVVERLGVHFVRILPHEKPAAAVGMTVRVAAPGGTIGHASIEAISPIAFDQFCYVKDGGGWKIAGFIGGDL
ncbi:MAG: hypothetical protein HY056_09290 [Proteobacteria bacterium]|nr:hypothetical protein [Pseudomonadota bacterium]